MFNDLFCVARETEQIPEPTDIDFQRWFESRKIAGQQRIARFDTLVTLDTIRPIGIRANQVVADMAQQTPLHPLWMAVLVFSSIGERFVGYTRRVLKADEIPNANLFNVECIDSTGVLGTPNELLTYFNELLLDYAGEQNTIVYLHYVRFMNFMRLEW